MFIQLNVHANELPLRAKIMPIPTISAGTQNLRIWVGKQEVVNILVGSFDQIKTFATELNEAILEQEQVPERVICRGCQEGEEVENF